MKRAIVGFGVLVWLLCISWALGAQTDVPSSGAFSAMKSVVPPAEKYIHIGGGFFSRFDNCAGHLTGENDAGSIRFRLENMNWESPFVYLPRGECTVGLPEGPQIVARMSRLDYVEDERNGRLLYRLDAEGEGCRIVLIGDCANPDLETRPVLEGQVLVEYDGHERVMTFRLSGRNETEAERHLNHVVYMRSDFDDSTL